MTARSEFGILSQRQLVLRRFGKHKLAVVSAFIVGFLYLVAAFAPFLSPHDPLRFDQNLVGAPPMPIRVFEDGKLQMPFVLGYRSATNLETMRREHTPDSEKRYQLRLFVRGHEYRVLGLIRTDLHLFGADGGYVHLLGTDRLGRDMLSRILYGAQISLSIGLVGVIVSFVLGVVIGGVSGLAGGLVDNVIQRGIEIIMSFPTIPLWMALAAALPREWSQIQVFFGVTVVLSLVGWTGLARVVRGKFMTLKDEDYVVAARLSGAGNGWVIRRHLVPAFTSHLIASLTLAVPGMILAETALSFLGLGLQQPMISWGVLLQEAQNVRSIATMPWVLTPVAAVIITILAFNFVGDGLRDAADPHA